MTAIMNDHVNRSVFIDLLKTIAITAVVLYHFEFMQYGYLGVDVFLVIAGYFTGKSIQKAHTNGKNSNLVIDISTCSRRFLPGMAL